MVSYHTYLLLLWYISVLSFPWHWHECSHVVRGLHISYFACRMCDVYLEWPQLSSGQPLRPVRNVLSCALTQAAIRDILSCPTYRCTAGSTLVSVSTAQTRAVVAHELPSWPLTPLRTQVTCGMEGWHRHRSGHSN